MKPATLTPEQQLMADTAEADFKLDLWDEPPALWAVINGPTGLHRVMFEFSDEFWQMGPMHVVLKAIDVSSSLMALAGVRLPLKVGEGEKIVGLIMRTEGWGVAGKEPDAPADSTRPLISDLQKWMEEGHRLSEHPDRVEVKIYQLLTDDQHFTLNLDRGGDPAGKWADSFEGRVPDALRGVFNSVKKAYGQ